MPALVPDLLSLLRAHPRRPGQVRPEAGGGYLDLVYENEKVRIYQVKGVKDNAGRTRHSDRY